MNRAIREIINLTFDILDAELSSYVVMNKYDELPDQLPSDIDIAVAASDFGKLDTVVGLIGNVTNLVITQKIWHNYQKCAYILIPLHVNERFRLQLDFFADFSVKSTPLLITSSELQSKTRKYGRFSVPDYDIEFVFLLMRRIYKNDFDLEHCRILKNILINNNMEKIVEYTNNYINIETTKMIIKNLLDNNVEGMQKMRTELWQLLRKLSKEKSKGRYWLVYWFDQFKRAVFRCKYPVGMSIAFLSPDGGGKSTYIDAIQTTCWGSFHYINIRYFRPRLFQNLGHYNAIHPSEESTSNTDPHGVVEDGKVKSFVRFMFYNLDFMLGGLMVKLASIHKTLTIFDRYYYDYYVDIKRYKYSFSQSIPYAFSWMIPMPQKVFFLDAKPEVLYERKKELPLVELERQCEGYRKATKKIKSSVIVDVTRPIEDVVDSVITEIMLYKAKETSKAMKLQIDKDNGIVII
jgi:hypothetical protein